jgi:spermidine/putrescine transport system substrate-binding protein
MTGDLSRRAFLRRAGAGAAGLAIGGPVLLSACSKSDASLHEVRVYNEPLSIDDVTPTFFEKATGTFLRYHEYTDPAQFVASRSAALRAHRDIGADVVVVPDRQAALMIDSGWVRELKLGASSKRALPAFANPRFDPGRRFSLPWTSTLVGLAYDRRFVRGPIRSVNALFDSRFAGKVALSADPASTLGLVALASGNDPATITETETAAALARVRAAVTSGQVRSFATTEYVDDLVSGRALLAVARADDINEQLPIWPTLSFVVPTEGGLLDSTNMLIPTGARNLAEARGFIDYVFRPDPISRFASFSGRVMPVTGGVASLQKIDVKTSFNPLTQPGPAVWERLSIWGGSAKSRAGAEFAALAASS